jgi:sulfur relay (sulfurtransferase) complex TusBCD TusD component (DsrE family)
MAKYTLIASRDPFESKGSADYYQLASDLKREGNDVTVFLVQNAVLGARLGASAGDLGKLTGAGVTVLADRFSLRERGIGTERLTAGVRASDIDVIVDHMAEGRKVVWH